MWVMWVMQVMWAMWAMWVGQIGFSLMSTSSNTPLPSLLDGITGTGAGPLAAQSPGMRAGNAANSPMGGSSRGGLVDERDWAPKGGKRGKVSLLLAGLNSFPSATKLATRRWWASRTSDPGKKKQTILWMRIAGAAAVVAIGVGGYFALRPVPQPDYMSDGLDDIFNYTLLTDEFNALPIDERMKLIGQLVARMKSMSTGDSMLMAGFATGIAGAARKQIEANASRLAIDMWDKYAKAYNSIGESDRGDYLDKTFLEFVKTMEAVAGESRDKPDDERLADVKKQAARDRERMKDTNRQPRAEDLSGAFRFMDQNVGGHASPEQRTRGLVMMRDMVRHFRGQDPSTGKPLPPK